MPEHTSAGRTWRCKRVALFAALCAAAVTAEENATEEAYFKQLAAQLASNASSLALRGSLMNFAAAQGTCTGSYKYNCRHNPVCCDPSTKCYEKDSAVAICLHSCSPGIHYNDPPQWRTPWTCKAVGWHAPSPPPAPSPLPPTPPTPSPAPPTPPTPSPAPAPPAGGPCTGSHGANCMHSGVCCDSSKTCFAKDDYYATCLESCSPGTHHSDPPQFRTPWSCKDLTPSAPSPPGPAPPQPSPPPAVPKDPLLLEPSDADVFTFYMYRAQSSTTYPPANVNTGNLAGIMWYIQNEVVSGAYGDGNHFGISRILRYKVQTKATQPLLNKGMNFGVRMAFDYGNCTGPSCDYSWQNYGYNVGCNKLGDYPFPKFETHYPKGIWYSLPGECPSMPYYSQTPECEKLQPGGMCHGTPTGTADCTWSYEDSGDQITLAELYEYSRLSERHFWGSSQDDAANSRKVDAAKALFAQKYGEDLPEPPCDFSFDKFYS